MSFDKCYSTLLSKIGRTVLLVCSVPNFFNVFFSIIVYPVVPPSRVDLEEWYFV